MKQLFKQLGFWFCKVAHGRPYWPIHGEYHCPLCHRTWPVPWSDNPPKIHAQPPQAREMNGIEKVWQERKRLAQGEVNELEKLYRR